MMELREVLLCGTDNDGSCIRQLVLCMQLAHCQTDAGRGRGGRRTAIIIERERERSVRAPRQCLLHPSTVTPSTLTPSLFTPPLPTLHTHTLPLHPSTLAPLHTHHLPPPLHTDTLTLHTHTLTLHPHPSHTHPPPPSTPPPSTLIPSPSTTPHSPGWRQMHLVFEIFSGDHGNVSLHALLGNLLQKVGFLRGGGGGGGGGWVRRRWMTGQLGSPTHSSPSRLRKKGGGKREREGGERE